MENQDKYSAEQIRPVGQQLTFPLDKPTQDIIDRMVALRLSTTINGLSGMQSFTTDGTFTVPSGKRYFKVICIGGGENGDKSTTSNTTGTSGVGADYCESVVDLDGVTTVTVTVGANGATGGDSSFGSYVVAKGGGSGTTSVGDVIVNGGSVGTTLFTGAGVLSADGGNTPLGFGGKGAFGSKGTSNGVIGNNATGYGAGGSGNANGSGASNFADGGLGTDGIVIITY